MTTIQSAVPMRVGAAIDETTGEVVEAGPRIGWLLDLVAELSTELMQRCWTPATFAALHDGVDSLGRKLPSTAAVAGRADRACHKLWCPIPPHLTDRDIRIWHLPTIAMHRGAPLLRFTITEAIPEPDTANATAALGIDWSPASLGAASVVAERGGDLVTDARTHIYNDRGLGVRLARLQTEGQQLSAKIDRLTRLAANAPETTQTQLNAKIAVLQQQRGALGAKRRRINRDIAFDFAASMTAMATASGAGVIAVEDLRALEPRNRGSTNNNRAAQSARRQAYRALEHTAARAGLEVVMCPPRGTSARCPGCDTDLARPNGYHSATCVGCGISAANRDQIAGQNIAKRVLLTRHASNGQRISPKGLPRSRTGRSLRPAGKPPPPQNNAATNEPGTPHDYPTPIRPILHA